MCKKKQFKYCPSTIDKCMRQCITTLDAMSDKGKIKVVSCCCGHGRYNKTIVVKNSIGWTWELLSGINLGRKKRFYKRDSDGYYYIPEINIPVGKANKGDKGNGNKKDKNL